MLKKAGIVVAAAAAGLLALSPLAFAGDKGYDHHESGDSYSYEETNIGNDNLNGNGNGNDILNVSENNVNVPLQACGNDVPVNVGGVQIADSAADLTGALGLFAEDTAAGNGDSPIGDDRNCDQAVMNDN